MSSRRLKGVLNNFLATLSSRYSDWKGYWLFGFLVESPGELRIDLLQKEPALSGETPITFAKQLAVQKFREQMAKAGLAEFKFREGSLHISRLPERTRGFVNGVSCEGNMLRLTAIVTTNGGKKYHQEVLVFAASHNPKLERRSARAD
jgi:hypothetical protein